MIEDLNKSLSEYLKLLRFKHKKKSRRDSNVIKYF